MSVKRGWYVLWAVLGMSLLVASCGKQHDRNDIVARVGDRSIDTTLLKRSFDLEPRWRKGMTREDAYNLQLQYLINEKLYALAARNAGLDTDATVAPYLRFVREKELIKALYAREVASRVVISDQEYDRSYRWMKKKVTFRFIFTPDSTRAIAYAAQMRTGNFERMGIADPLHEVKGIRRDVAYGDIAPEIEASVFDAALHEVRGPVAIEGGFMVIQIADGVVEKFASEYEAAERRSAIRHLVFGRRADSLARVYISGLMSDKNLTLNPEVFFALSEFTSRRISEAQVKATGPGGMAIRDDELRVLSNDIAAMADRPLATFKGGSLSVRGFLDKIAAMPPGMRPRARSTQSLKDAIAVVVRNEFLAEAARDEGLEKDPLVQREIASQTDEALAAAWFGRQKDVVPVTPAEVDSAKHGSTLSEEEALDQARGEKFAKGLPELVRQLQQKYPVTVDSTRLRSFVPNPKEVLTDGPIRFFTREIFQ